MVERSVLTEINEDVICYTSKMYIMHKSRNDTQQYSYCLLVNSYRKWRDFGAPSAI